RQQRCEADLGYGPRWTPPQDRSPVDNHCPRGKAAAQGGWTLGVTRMSEKASPPFRPRTLDRRTVLKLAAAGAGAPAAARLIAPTLASAAPAAATRPGDFVDTDTGPVPLIEATIAQLQEAMASGAITARQLVEHYTDRIHRIDKSGPMVNAVLELNP